MYKVVFIVIIIYYNITITPYYLMAIQIGYTFHFDFKGTSLLNYFYTPQLKLKYLFIWGFLTIAVAADYKKPIYFETE